MYMFYFVQVDGVIIDGSPYLPEYRIEYTSFSADLKLGIQGCCLVFGFGLVQVAYKKPAISFLQFLLAGGIGYLWF